MSAPDTGGGRYWGERATVASALLSLSLVLAAKLAELSQSMLQMQSSLEAGFGKVRLYSSPLSLSQSLGVLALGLEQWPGGSPKSGPQAGLAQRQIRCIPAATPGPATLPAQNRPGWERAARAAGPETGPLASTGWGPRPGLTPTSFF